MASNPHEVAAHAAQGFDTLACEACALNIRNALVAAGHPSYLVEIRGNAGRDFIVCLSHDGGQNTITYNGRHLGVQVGDLVFDNLHGNGLALDKWLPILMPSVEFGFTH